MLVGLTFEETITCMSHKRAFFEPGGRCNEDKDTYLRLCSKHEAARLAVIAAEAESRDDTLTRP